MAGTRPSGDARPNLRAEAAAVAASSAGVGALLALAAIGKADLFGALVAGATVAAVGVVLALRSRVRAPSTPPAGSGAAPASPAGEETSIYALALELAPNPVMLVTGGEPDDLAGRRIMFANAAARELLHIPRQGVLLLAALRHPDVLDAMDASLFGGLDQTFTYDTGGPNSRQWRVWVKPLPVGESHVRAALVVMRDDTEIQLNERRRSDFLANASHELRTPLASLSGFIETLRGHAKDDEAARERFLAIMTRQADRMARLIDDLLSLSRIELNEHIRPSGVCELCLVVKDVADALGPLIADKAVTLEARLPEEGAATIGDRDQIVQVVQNLVDNAVKYSAPGATVEVGVDSGLTLEEAAAIVPGDNPRLSDPAGGRISLLTQGWTSDKYVRLTVIDHGQGMGREYLPRLSERFYRVEGQKSAGTGLGLAIVKHIVNRHRGGLVVESAPGRGTAFVVYLPMSPEPAPRPGRGHAASPATETTAPQPADEAIRRGRELS